MPDDRKVTHSAAAESRPTDWAAGLFEANQRAFGRWFQGAIALSQEVAQFAQSRLQEDMAAWMALTGARNPADVMTCQQRFAERTVACYAEEIRKLSQMMIAARTEGPAASQQQQRGATE